MARVNMVLVIHGKQQKACWNCIVIPVVVGSSPISRPKEKPVKPALPQGLAGFLFYAKEIHQGESMEFSTLSVPKLCPKLSREIIICHSLYFSCCDQFVTVFLRA
jgi:hypothetical protein